MVYSAGDKFIEILYQKFSYENKYAHIQKFTYFPFVATGLRPSWIFKFFKSANKDSSAACFFGDDDFDGFVFSCKEAQFPPVMAVGSPHARREQKRITK